MIVFARFKINILIPLKQFKKSYIIRKKLEVKKMKWTEEQSKAIFEKNNNILVAAAARKSEKQRF